MDLAFSRPVSGGITINKATQGSTRIDEPSVNLMGREVSVDEDAITVVEGRGRSHGHRVWIDRCLDRHCDHWRAHLGRRRVEHHIQPSSDCTDHGCIRRFTLFRGYIPRPTSTGSIYEAMYPRTRRMLPELDFVQQGKGSQDDKVRDVHVTFYPLRKRNDFDRICPVGQSDFSRDCRFCDSAGRRRHEDVSIDRELCRKIVSSSKRRGRSGGT